MYMYLNSINV